MDPICHTLGHFRARASPIILVENNQPICQSGKQRHFSASNRRLSHDSALTASCRAGGGLPKADIWCGRVKEWHTPAGPTVELHGSYSVQLGEEHTAFKLFGGLPGWRKRGRRQDDTMQAYNPVVYISPKGQASTKNNQWQQQAGRPELRISNALHCNIPKPTSWVPVLTYASAGRKLCRRRLINSSTTPSQVSRPMRSINLGTGAASQNAMCLRGAGWTG